MRSAANATRARRSAFSVFERPEPLETGRVSSVLHRRLEHPHARLGGERAPTEARPAPRRDCERAGRVDGTRRSQAVLVRTPSSVSRVRRIFCRRPSTSLSRSVRVASRKVNRHPTLRCPAGMPAPVNSSNSSSCSSRSPALLRSTRSTCGHRHAVRDEERQVELRRRRRRERAIRDMPLRRRARREPRAILVRARRGDRRARETAERDLDAERGAGPDRLVERQSLHRPDFSPLGCDAPQHRGRRHPVRG